MNGEATSPSQVLVTGATGFLGRHLIYFLARQPGVKVCAISRRGGRVGEVEVDAVDLASPEAFRAWRKDSPPSKAIFHLAAAVPSSFAGSEAQQAFLLNQLIDYHVLTKAISDQAAVIYASSSSIYGSLVNTPYSEEMLPLPANWYSLGKYFGELTYQMAHDQFGIPASSLRISAPYGPGQKARTVINIFLANALASKDLTLFGTGRRTQDFTYVEDVVQAFWLAFQKRASGVYNIGGGQPVSMRELAGLVISLVPECRSQIVYSGKADPQETFQGIYSLERIKEALGYHPRWQLRDGLQACLAAGKAL